MFRMIKNEKYLQVLKSITVCISNGDYYSAKELSNLELDRMRETDKVIDKDIKKSEKIGKSKKDILKKYSEYNMEEGILKYSNYITKKIENAKDLQELKKETISFEEFMKKVIA